MITTSKLVQLSLFVVLTDAATPSHASEPFTAAMINEYESNVLRKIALHPFIECDTTTLDSAILRAFFAEIDPRGIYFTKAEVDRYVSAFSRDRLAQDLNGIARELRKRRQSLFDQARKLFANPSNDQLAAAEPVPLIAVAANSLKAKPYTGPTATAPFSNYDMHIAFLSAADSMLNCGTLHIPDTSRRYPGYGVFVRSSRFGYQVTNHAALARRGLTVNSTEHIVGIKPKEGFVDITGIPLTVLARLLKSPMGSEITLSLLDEDSLTLRTMVVTRQTHDERTESRIFSRNGRKFGYFCPCTWHGRTPLDQQAKEIFASFEQENIDVILLDIRECNLSGAEATRLLPYFSSQPPAISCRNIGESNLQTIETDFTVEAIDKPVVVLCDRHECVGAEVLAQALKGEPSVLVVGGPSSGTSSIIAPALSARAVDIDVTVYIPALFFYINERPLAAQIVEPDIDFDAPTNHRGSTDRLSGIREKHQSRCNELSHQLAISDAIFDCEEFSLSADELLRLADDFAELRAAERNSQAEE